jgi:hypothetical protein
MFANQDRNQLRRFYFESWRKARQGLPLEPLERLIADVVAEHPEYHRLLEDEDTALARDYTPEGGQTNPFLHMGMHIALREQVAVNRPVGVRPAHRRLCRALGDASTAEHAMMECLAETIWMAQRAGTAPDDAHYLASLQSLVERVGGASRR